MPASKRAVAVGRSEALDDLSPSKQAGQGAKSRDERNIKVVAEQEHQPQSTPPPAAFLSDVEANLQFSDGSSRPFVMRRMELRELFAVAAVIAGVRPDRQTAYIDKLLKDTEQEICEAPPVLEAKPVPQSEVAVAPVDEPEQSPKKRRGRKRTKPLNHKPMSPLWDERKGEDLELSAPEIIKKYYRQKIEDGTLNRAFIRRDNPTLYSAFYRWRDEQVAAGLSPEPDFPFPSSINPRDTQKYVKIFGEEGPRILEARRELDRVSSRARRAVARAEKRTPG